jgi:gliding motility-associated-like protein
VVVGGASNGSDSWCAAPATDGGSSFGIDITGNGANANIISSSVLAGSAGAGGLGCSPDFPPNGANGIAQNVRVAGTVLATNQSSFNLAAQPTIRMDDIACTNTPIDFRTAASNNWTFGVGSTPGSASGATVTTMYSNLGRKDIGYSGNDYIGFGNIILDDQIIPEFTTNIPIIQGQYRICVGESVGVQATNGGVGYTYIWSVDGVEVYRGVGEDYESFVTTLTTPGIFEFQLNYETSCCGLSLPSSIQVYVEDTPEAVAPGDQQVCFGGLDGVELTVTGGVVGGSISWVPSTGLTSNNSYTVTALPSVTTTYDITLSDSTGLCVDYVSITVEVVDIELVTSVVDATCGPTGEVSVSVTGGSGNYSYLWTPGGYTTATVTNLQSGTYSVLVTDNTNGCQDSAFAVINAAPGALVGFISNSTDVTCNGLTDGSITVTVVGGVPPYTYEWSEGATVTSGSTSNTLSGLTGGDYEVTVTDDTGCTYVSLGSVYEPSVVLFDVDTLFDPTCAGIDDGYIRVTTDGGIAPYTYIWNGFPGATDNFLGGLPSGTYTIVATDFNGCQDSLEVTIQAPPIPEFVDDTVICAGTMYTFANGSQEILFSDSLSFDTLFDVNGCPFVQRINIIVIPLPSASITGDGTVCDGESTTILFTGTPDATLTYNINGGPDLNIVLDATGNASVNTGALSSNVVYTLTEVASATIPVCTQSLNESATVVVVSLPDAAISGTSTICSGSSADVTFTGTPNSIVTYTINGGANQTVTLNASGNAIVSSGAIASNQVYELVSVELQPPSSCFNAASGSVTITVLDLPTVAISGTTTICSGDNVNIAFTGTPGAIVTYTINGGASQTITLDGAGNATVNTGALTANATYQLISVRLSGTPNCEQPATGNAVVTVIDLPTASVTGTTICSGQSGSVTFTGTPNATVTYTVNGGANQTVTLNAAGTATVNTGVLVANATYQLVSVQSATTPVCSNTLTGNAIVNVTPLPTASISGTVSICSGDGAIITLSGTPNATVTYTINGGAGQTVTLNASGAATISTGSLTVNTTYTLVSVDNGTCVESVSGSATITVNPTFSQTVAATICSNETFFLPNGTPVNIAGSYPVTLTSSQGCDSVIITNLTVNQLGSFFPLRDFSICEEIPFDLNIQAQNMVSYEWQVNQGTGVFVSLDNNPQYQGATTSTLSFNLNTSLHQNVYRVVMTDQCGNVYSDEMRLSVFEPTPVDNPVPDQTICQHDLRTIRVNYNGTDYVWNDGTEGASITPEESGQYIVTFVENGTNCIISDTINVVVEDCIANCVVLAPTGFTPDENGVNDIFRVVTSCDEGFASFDFKVFNRWGELVFQTNNPREGWDGWYKGRRAEIGVYVFYIEYSKNFSNSVDFIKGNVTLVR